MTAGTEPRYTLAEAREMLANEKCDREGHLLTPVRWGAGPVVRVECGRCPVTFVPPELPPLPPDEELREDVFTAGGGPGTVRTIHIPTGLVGVGGGGRTGIENQGRARGILRAKLYARSLGDGRQSSPEPILPDIQSDHVRYDMVTDGTGNTGGYAIKAVHIPTGIVAEASAPRSDQQKREVARDLLRARLLVAQLEREASA